MHWLPHVSAGCPTFSRCFFCPHLALDDDAASYIFHFSSPVAVWVHFSPCFGAKENEQILDRRGDNVYGYKAEMKLKTADSALFNIEVYNSSMTPKARR